MLKRLLEFGNKVIEFFIVIIREYDVRISYFGDIFDCASDRFECMPQAHAALIAAPKRTPFSV